MKRVVIVGAGLSGLECARRLAERGVEPIVLEKSRGLGGRCATRRFDGQPVDYGPGFYHGSSDPFLGALRAVTGATVLEGWPSRVEGVGMPCQPGAFAPGEKRLAFREGMTAFAKHLASGLDVRRETRVTGIEDIPSGVAVRLESGDNVRGDAAVLAIPSPQARRLLNTLPAPPDTGRALLALHDGIASTSCLTLIAGYPASDGQPDWDVLHPEDSRMIQAILHDSAKREAPKWTALTLQAHSSWSRTWLERDDSEWTRELLAEAGRLCGEWASQPAWTHAHRWRYARVTGDSVLATPLVLRLNGGARVGLTGDAFGLSGGAEAAFLAGRRIAERLLASQSGS